MKKKETDVIYGGVKMLEYQFPELVPLTKGASFSLIFQHLYYIHLLRYSTADMLKELTKSVKIATKKKLDYLQETGYLVKKDNVIVSTAKTLDLLCDSGYKRELLPPVAEGVGAEIYTQQAICKLLQHPFYKSFLYPHFDYVIPDGLLILQDGDRYQLNFVEVERKKPNWAEYLEDKRQKYNRLSKDEITWKYWEQKAPHLGLKCPPVDDFRFSVICVSELKFEWEGWSFDIYRV